MFQPQPTPFASSALFSSLPSSYGLNFPPVFGLPQDAHAGDGEQLGPTHRGLTEQFMAHSQIVTHTHRHSGPSTGSASLSGATAAALHPQQQQHFHSSQRLLPTQHPSPQETLSGDNSSHQHQPRPARKMEGQDSHDMVAQQEAARDYQPDLQGPLIGDKLPSLAIAHEYAKADPVYIEKTETLPQTYSHYRPIQGDGNCGWRAIGFSYFEKLIERGDSAQVEGEVARLKSLYHLIANVGRYNYFEAFAEEVIDLLLAIAPIVSEQESAKALIHQRWNDSGVEPSLIYFFRVLAGTFLKANAATYEPFIPEGQSIAVYCSQNIDAVNREIEHIGIVALVNILLKPVGFVLEIAYLDRSAGSQVNQYRVPEEENEEDVTEMGSIIYLLYRPDHYDILYRSPPPVTTSPHHLSVDINRATEFNHNTAFAGTPSNMGAFASINFGTLTLIPGLSAGEDEGLAGMMPLPSASTATSPIINGSFSPTQPDPWMAQYASDVQSIKKEPASQPPPAIATVQHPSPSSSITPTTPQCPTSSMIPVSTNIGAPQLSPHLPTAEGAGYPIRFSPHQLEYENNSFPEPTFQVTTTTFKNSIWNRAHYGNPDFQPEEFVPEVNSIDNRSAGRKKVRKDS
ncbi:hypothetical protein QQS21_012608 [Conoideocrella luteorostrata]|uniref:ubiquitinyl hydrolase 1 n=1 Tax=Conoideocrella luteorostrata TaxID=1105319 RepID=A0AAJ0CB62_9HYPO|nr:hypothetical protein QQS21_012608 [Conoideocrella luteorostrata]